MHEHYGLVSTRMKENQSPLFCICTYIRFVHHMSFLRHLKKTSARQNERHCMTKHHYRSKNKALHAMHQWLNYSPNRS